jgi:hypothetical protein
MSACGATLAQENGNGCPCVVPKEASLTACMQHDVAAGNVCLKCTSMPLFRMGVLCRRALGEAQHADSHCENMH